MAQRERGREKENVCLRDKLSIVQIEIILQRGHVHPPRRGVVCPRKREREREEEKDIERDRETEREREREYLTQRKNAPRLKRGREREYVHGPDNVFV